MESRRRLLRIRRPNALSLSLTWRHNDVPGAGRKHAVELVRVDPEQDRGLSTLEPTGLTRATDEFCDLGIKTQETGLAEK